MNSDTPMHKITPEYLTEYANFKADKKDWRYRREEAFSIPKIQAEGAAKIWNMLLDKKISLLADEVGMGKTIQGLAVMATLWRQKSNAKVLLYAPNENVAKKWIREYENFIRYHYRLEDNLVKSSVQGMPLRKAVYCENHLELMQKANQKWPSFFVCKTSSLSGFLSPKINDETIQGIGINLKKTVDDKSEDEEAKCKWMYLFGKKSNERLYKLFSKEGSPPFDLIIFDEAHYLRRSEGHSNRGISAHAFFSGRDIRNVNPWEDFFPIADKTLLLTATPNHSSPSDIVNITSLFHPDYRKKKPLEILDDICVRRFRRLAGKTKHEYREEISEGVEMQHLSERLFFAAYHKSLVKAKAEDYNRDTEKKRLDNPYRVLFGYLEGFEFLPQNSQPKNKKVKQNDGPDFHERDDTEVIVGLSNMYKRAYKVRPEHPKYRKITEGLQPNVGNNYAPEKKVVFVRRIASVYEISSRVIEFYDLTFKSFLHDILSKKQYKHFEANARQFFWRLSQGDTEFIDETGTYTTAEENEPTENDRVPESTILGLFTVKKEGKYKSTDCSNFRLRFLKKDQIFSIFFEPPSDYSQNQYRLQHILQNKQNKRVYKTTAQQVRVISIGDEDSRKLVLEQHFEINNPDYETIKIPEVTLETLFTIWLTYEIQNLETKDLILDARAVYNSLSVYEKEGFSQYLEKGILFSSQYVVRFYALYRLIIRGQNLRGDDLYKKFCARVRLHIEEIGLSLLIARAALTFKVFYKKELGSTEENIIRENWTFLNNTIPVYPVCGDTNRDSIRKAFNSPFYPDVLVATSVLQEGVDLHYHCSEIIHYGIAWTQGDNEQRVGRVDRMFGKVDGQLQANHKATLPIHYPYLKNTIDQDQLGRFILRKHESEKLLDQLKNVQFSNEINFREQVPEDVWQKCLNIPGNNTIEHDPFPVHFEHVSMHFDQAKEQPEISGYLHPLFNSLKHRFGKEFVLFRRDMQQDEDKKIFAIRHFRSDDRHQPIIGELGYSEEGLYFMNKPVYYLRISSPLARSNKNMGYLYNSGLIKKIYNDHPILKICLNKTVRGFFRYYVCADLPLFSLHQGGYNLSHQEIIRIIEDVIDFTDELEQVIHGMGFDITHNEVLKQENESWNGGSSQKLVEDRPFGGARGWRANDSGAFLYKERFELKNDPEEIYKFNHAQYCVRKINEGGQTKIQSGVYKNDALEEECFLLNEILNSIVP